MLFGRSVKMSLNFVYVMVGLAIAMPVGAITVEMTKQVLKNGLIYGWAVGIGSMTIDLLLIVALYIGLANYLALPYIQFKVVKAQKSDEVQINNLFYCKLILKII